MLYKTRSNTGNAISQTHNKNMLAGRFCSYPYTPFLASHHSKPDGVILSSLVIIIFIVCCVPVKSNVRRRWQQKGKKESSIKENQTILNDVQTNLFTNIWFSCSYNTTPHHAFMQHFYFTHSYNQLTRTKERHMRDICLCGRWTDAK